MPLGPLCWFAVTFPTTLNQIGPFWCSFPGGWVCVCSRTLWFSPMNSPVRLGVSPTDPQPPQVFSVRGFEALFPHTGALGCAICLAPQLFLLVYPQANVGPPSPPAAASPAPVLQMRFCCESSPPWLPVSIPPTCLNECFSFNSLVVRLPYGSAFWQF